MHPWFRYETYIAASCAAVLWVAFLSHWLSSRFSPPHVSKPVKMLLLLLGSLCLIGNSIRAADLSCVNDVLSCPAMKGMIDTSTGFLLDALTVGSLAYMRSLQALQMQTQHIVPQALRYGLGALLVAFHLFSIIIAVIEKELLNDPERNEPALVRALTSKYLALDILVLVLLSFIIFVCVRLRRSLLRHLHTLTAVTHNSHHTPSDTRQGRRIKKSSTAPAPTPALTAAAATTPATVQPAATSASGEPGAPSAVTADRGGVVRPAANGNGPPRPRPVLLHVAPHSSSLSMTGTTGSPTIVAIPEESEVVAAVAPQSPTHQHPPASSVVGAAELRAHEISMAVRKLILSVAFVVGVCVLGVATSFQSMIAGLRGDAGPLRALIYPPDPERYSERRLLVYMIQCGGLVIIVWYTWQSPRRWIDSLLARRTPLHDQADDAPRKPPPFWATCVHGLSVTSSAEGRRRGAAAAAAAAIAADHKPAGQAAHADAVIDLEDPAGVASPESQLQDDRGAAGAFADPRGFAPPVRLARGELDSMASYAPTGLSMRSGVTSIKAQQLPGAVYDAYASRYGGASMLLGAVTHLGSGGGGGGGVACECAPGHCYCAPEMDDANFPTEEDQAESA